MGQLRFTDTVGNDPVSCLLSFGEQTRPVIQSRETFDLLDKYINEYISNTKTIRDSSKRLRGWPCTQSILEREAHLGVSNWPREYTQLCRRAASGSTVQTNIASHLSSTFINAGTTALRAPRLCRFPSPWNIPTMLTWHHCPILISQKPRPIIARW